MDFFFYPTEEKIFKEEAINNFVRTVVFDTSSKEIVKSFTRKVHKRWDQSCKNNIETDHRIKTLTGDNYQIYSWVVESENDFGLPNFTKI